MSVRTSLTSILDTIRGIAYISPSFAFSFFFFITASRCFTVSLQHRRYQLCILYRLSGACGIYSFYLVVRLVGWCLGLEPGLRRSFIFHLSLFVCVCVGLGFFFFSFLFFDLFHFTSFHFSLPIRYWRRRVLIDNLIDLFNKEAYICNFIHIDSSTNESLTETIHLSKLLNLELERFVCRVM